MELRSFRGSGLVLLLLVGSAISLENGGKVSNFNLTTSGAIRYAIGGARVIFTDLPLGNDSSSLSLKCLVHSKDGSGSVEDEAAVSYDRKTVTCRIPPNVSAGKVQVDLEVSDPEGKSVTQLFSQSSFIDPEPPFEVLVEEDWTNQQLKLTWEAQYFEGQYPPGFAIYLEAAIYMSDYGAPAFNPTSVRIPVGFNDVGSGTVPLSDAMIQDISTFNYPYYYMLRQAGTQSQIYQTSGLLTPTLGKTEEIAKEICSAWLLDAPGPPTESIPCPNCHCKASIDPEFKKVEYNPQILKLAGGKLANHELFYQRVPTAGGHAQSCSYNVPTNALATSSPATAGWIYYISRDISYVENYLSDIWPYIACCLQTNSAQYCESFHQRRPVDTGHNYPGPDDPCQGTGDPHMITFDGIRYDFMGWGEFWLIHGPGSDSGHFGVQGRMAPLSDTQLVSYYKAIALRDGETTVQIQHGPGGVLQIVLNGADLLTIPQEPITLPVGNASIYVNGVRVEVRLATGFTIKLDSYPALSAFNVFGSGSLSNKGKGFMGIFGNFDGDPENDLTNRGGTVIPPTAENIRNLSLLHNVFGLSWMTSPEESFFTYEDGLSWESYANPEFGPIFEYPDPSTMPEEVRAICKENLACYYEYVGTGGDLGEAEEAAKADDQFEELKEEIAKEILLCGEIGSPEHGRVDVEGYLNGSRASYSCVEEYELAGDASRICMEGDGTADWDGEEPICNWTCGLCTQETDYQLSHDPSDCTKFFLCTAGVRHFLVCPPGEAFNRQFLVCEKDYECADPPGC